MPLRVGGTRRESRSRRSPLDRLRRLVGPVNRVAGEVACSPADFGPGRDPGARRRDTRLGLALCSAFGALTLVGAVWAPSAGATTCSSSGGAGRRYYAGQASLGAVRAGLKGELPLSGMAKRGARFQIVRFAAGRNSDGYQYWIQTGHGWGNVGGYQSVGSSLNVYAERQDVNGYQVRWNPDGAGPTWGEYAWVKVVAAGDPDVIRQWEAYVWPQDHAPVRTTTAFLPYGMNQHIEAKAESYYENDGACSQFSPYQYMGAFMNGDYNTSTKMYQTDDGDSWTLWNSDIANGNPIADAPYHASTYAGTHAMIRVWGE